MALSDGASSQNPSSALDDHRAATYKYASLRLVSHQAWRVSVSCLRVLGELSILIFTGLLEAHSLVSEASVAMGYQKLLLVVIFPVLAVLQNSLVLAVISLPSSCVPGDGLDITTDFAAPLCVSTFNGSYFTYTGFRGGPSPGPGQQASLKATVNEFPALQGQRISFILMYFQSGGVLAPHFHPRGSKLIYVIQGNLTVGFIDTTNKQYNQTLLEGDCFVVPKGMVHYMANLYSAAMTKVIFSFSAPNPGTMSIPPAVFGSYIPDTVLTASFQVNASVIHTLEAPY